MVEPLPDEPSPDQLSESPSCDATSVHVPMFGAHSRSPDMLPFAHATTSYSSGWHAVQLLQTRSVVAVGAVTWYWPVVQFVSAAHARFCVPFPFAQAVVWYWLPPHTVHVPQTRSLVVVGAVL
jgi:hypothetical protein